MRSISSQHCFIGVSIVTSTRKEQIAQFWALTKTAQTRAFTTSVLHKLISSQAEDSYQLHETQTYGAKHNGGTSTPATLRSVWQKAMRTEHSWINLTFNLLAAEFYI
jgi:hypothetical protein